VAPTVTLLQEEIENLAREDTVLDLSFDIDCHLLVVGVHSRGHGVCAASEGSCV